MVDLLTKETKHPPTEGDDRTRRAPPASPSSGTARAALDATRPAHWAAVKLLEARGHQLWDLSQPSASARATQQAQGSHLQLCGPGLSERPGRGLASTALTVQKGSALRRPRWLKRDAVCWQQWQEVCCCVRGWMLLETFS